MNNKAHTIKAHHEAAELMAERYTAILMADNIDELDAQDMSTLLLDVEYNDEDYSVLAAQLNGGTGMVVGIVVDDVVEFIIT